MTKSGLVTTISGSGAYTAGTSDPLTRWEANEAGSTILLTTLSGGNPDRLIIGPDSLGNFNPTLGGLFDNANASIIGDNPTILGSATFVITATGVTTSSTLSNVVFGVGTANETIPGTKISELPPPTPEPASLAIWGLGALGCAIAGYRRRKTLLAN